MNDRRHQNMGKPDRIISGVLGGSLLFLGLAKRNKFSVLPALGGAGLLYQSIRGHSQFYDLFGINTSHQDLARAAVVAHNEGRKIEKSVLINKPAEELYLFWRNFNNLPRIMEHLESVDVIDNRYSHWKAKAPAGQSVEWDAEIYNEIPNEFIAWKSLPGSDVQHAGSVHFKRSKIGRGTEVKVVLNYHPPAGKVGAAIAKLFGEEPGQQLKEDLRCFKQLMEGTL